MASKTHLLIFLSIAIMATSIADAQLPPISLPLPLPLPIPIPISLPGIFINVSGTVNCTLNSTAGGSAPAFPNATVQLQCPVGNTIATATTNSSGGFTVIVNALQVPLINLATCRVVVVTPLVNCNASLTSPGRLVSGPLNLVGATINGLRIVLLFLASGFSLNAAIGIN